MMRSAKNEVLIEFWKKIKKLSKREIKITGRPCSKYHDIHPILNLLFKSENPNRLWKKRGTNGLYAKLLSKNLISVVKYTGNDIPEKNTEYSNGYPLLIQLSNDLMDEIDFFLSLKASVIW